MKLVFFLGDIRSHNSCNDPGPIVLCSCRRCPRRDPSAGEQGCRGHSEKGEELERRFTQRERQRGPVPGKLLAGGSGGSPALIGEDLIHGVGKFAARARNARGHQHKADQLLVGVDPKISSVGAGPAKVAAASQPAAGAGAATRADAQSESVNAARSASDLRFVAASK